MATPPAVTTVRVNMEQLALEQARQDELDARNGVEDGLDAGGEGDDTGGVTEPVAEDLIPPAKPIPRSPADEARNAIAARFKRTDEVPFNGDMTDPEMIYGAVGRKQALEPDEDASIVGEVLEPEPEPEPDAAPQMITRKVRGKDVTKSLDDWLADATKVTAADSYLEESRKLLEFAEKEARAKRARQHPDGQEGTQDDGQDIDPQDQPDTTGDDLSELVEQIQFGDPKEAAKRLKGAIRKEASSIAGEEHLSRLFDNDLAKSQQALKAFKKANPDLAADEIAAVVIERSMYAAYREDICKLEVDEAKIPTDPVALANWHRFYRINGYDMRSTPALLEAAKAKVIAYRGAATPKPAPRKEAPRVNVNVDRTERRMAIPNQPTRAAVPRRDPAPQAPARTPGSDVVAEMRRARGQLTG